MARPTARRKRMDIRTIGLPLLCAALVLGCAQQAEQPAVSTEADRQAIDQVREQEVAAINSGDLSLGYAADDIITMPPGEPALVGKPALQAWVEAFVSQVTASLSYAPTDIVVAGDLAVEHYTGTLTATPVGGGDSVTEALKGIHVYQRQADGSWKMTHDVWNLDAPPGE
jgi:ketosteroid isomerase-like protein